MLLIKPAVEALLEKGRQEGLKAGAVAKHTEWAAWNARRLEAESKGEDFDEPPPSEPDR